MRVLDKGGDEDLSRSRVWAITSYFCFDDPDGVKRRLRVYREFRRRLQIPLVAVELSREGAFDLTAADAEVLVQVRGGHVMWQKERLLNRALEALPDHCDTVAWMDCDAVLRRQDWAEGAREMLKEVHLVQPFDRLYHLKTDTLPGLNSPLSLLKCLDSVARRFCQNNLPEAVYRTQGTSVRLGYAPGLVWVASRDLVERYGLYDAAIVGSGDKVIFSSACGRCEDVAVAYRMNRRQKEHFDAWARPFSQAVGGRIGYIEGEAYHLWHGDLASRRYGTRYEGFEVFEFDPLTDIARNVDGAWCWSSDKPRMHEFVRQFFQRRREDPTPPRTAALPDEASPAVGL